MKHLFILALCVSVFSCKQNKENNTFVVDEKLQKELQEQFILVEDGGTIELPEGNYKFSKSLSMEGKKTLP